MNKPPRDGTMILASFKNCPGQLSAMWNGTQNQWVAAMPQVDFYEGVQNDCYFESGYFDDSELIDWKPNE